MTKEYKYKIGDIVEINSATFGWGKAVKGDLGCVTYVTIDEETKSVIYTLQEDLNRFTNWNCLEKDIELFDLSNKKNVSLRFFKRYVSFLSRIPEYAQGEKEALSNDLVKLYQDIQKKALLSRSLVRYIDKWKDTVEGIAEDKATQDKFGVLLGNMYESIDFEPSGIRIIGVTKPIFVTVKDMKIPLGRYTVTIHYQQGLTSINRAKGDSEYNRKSRFEHPHISDSIPCLGDYHLPIVQAMEKSDYLSIFEIVYNFLSTVYISGTYISPLYWATDRTKRCRNCWELLDKCVCNNKERFNPVTMGDRIREGEEEIAC